MQAIKVKSKGGKMPEYQTEHASGADVCANEEAEIAPGEVKLVGTGLFLEIPEGYEIQVRPRSGLALKHGVTLLNTTGTIDADYRGEVKVIMVNHGKQAFKIKKGDRIAQFVMHKVERADFQETEELKESRRGQGGFGSTGVA
ncbi:dUTP diphosphatase [Candidatus Micrarchaeota archaeon]|nr:dUTP diphosphatase [Candidatus Micrarchaeota archaeon]